MSLIMGIVNVTPDSFSDGGLYLEKNKAIAHARQLINEGADVIDIGGESTRPGATPITIKEEASRVLPVISALVGEARISIDTRHEEIARLAVQEGATIINDVSASLDQVAAELQVGWVAMHMQGTPQTMQNKPEYEDVVGEVCNYLTEKAVNAKNEGVSEIWIDPGIGFGKNLKHNITLISKISIFHSLGFPILLGISRKKFIKDISGTNDSKERIGGTVSTVLFCMLQGVQILRVHDVNEIKQSIKVFKSINND